MKIKKGFKYTARNCLTDEYDVVGGFSEEKDEAYLLCYPPVTKKLSEYSDFTEIEPLTRLEELHLEAYYLYSL